MDLVRRARFALCAAILFVCGLAALSSCTTLLGIDTHYDENDCLTGKQLPPLACGVGACRTTVPACDEKGLPNTCTPALDQKKDETPDGLDNNCDGLIDEGTPCTDGARQTCYRSSTLTRNIGLCHDGTQECAAGRWGDCMGDQLPDPEKCDHRDNDCDGAVDNGCPCAGDQKQKCYGGAESTHDKGACTSGEQQCESGSWGDCSGDMLPLLEVCDGIDNDCNGDVDPMPACECIDGTVEPCYPAGAPMGVAGVGECVLGTSTCVKGKHGACIGAVLPKPEVCNGKDDDCNTMNDDGANLGVGLDCNIPPNGPGTLGPCSIGKTICGPMGPVCQQTVFSTSELCNGKDDDCDGIPDNGNPGGGALCLVMSVPQPLGECAKGHVFCEGGALICKQENLPVPETCNKLDDDCNNDIDNGNLCCPDGALNGTETDTDCGGPCVLKCANGQKCIQDFDCQSFVCANKFCQNPTCNDQTKNGNEADVDCGIVCPNKCSIGASCKVPNDCTSGVCTNYVCVGPGCSDLVKNGNESDVDCGGSNCAKCDPGQKCNTVLDCISSVCTLGICQPPSCNDTTKNGTETDVDCGGSCVKCNIGQKCNVPSDCTSSVCTGDVCIAPTCADLVKNGSETDIDCGGLCPVKCAILKICNINNDCTTNVCSGGFCAQKPPGAPCLAANECAGNNCVDGVCCNSACTGLCEACIGVKKGFGNDGFCGKIGAGADPDNECTDQGANTCGTDGYCNGTGECRFYPNTTVCVLPSCSADGVTLTQVTKCNGTGACNNGGGMMSCAPALCSNGACGGPCVSDANCASGAYCKGNICVAKQIDGEPCLTNNACLSGSCTDGVCCNLPCNGSCQACTLVKQGPGGPGNGLCGNIAGGLDPDSECPAQLPSTCGLTGACSGFGSCALFNSTAECQPASCQADGVTLNNQQLCNGSGTCLNSGTTVCAPYACNGGVCLSTCTVDSQCAPAAYCNGTNCLLKKTISASCTVDKECQSNHCADGVCCNTACTGLCQACTNAKNGVASDGTCAPIKVGLDPEAECVDQGANTCGTTGVCDGVGACQNYPGGVIGNQITGDCKENQCDGAGHVVSVIQNSDVPVDNNQCTNDVCTSGVPSNPATASGTACNQNGGTVCNGSSACVQCVVASTCPGVDTECRTRTCTSNTCGFSYTAAGTATLSQALGDCKENQCDGAGNVVIVVKNVDIPVDNNQCTNDVCTNGVPSNPPTASGTACSQMGGTVCNGSGACVQCVVGSTCPGMDTDCQTRTCTSNTCGFSFAASGTPTSMQTAGDCKENQCNGSGGVVVVNKNTDLPVDSNQCTNDVCTNGVPSNPPTASGTACNQMGGTVCNGSGVCVQCVAASSCPGMDTDCQMRTCTSNTCGFSFAASGTPTSMQTTGDCKENQCNGSGGVVVVNKNTDLPIDGNQCTNDVCTNGVPSNPPTASGTACNQMGGTVCNGSSACVQCVVPADCPLNGACVSNICEAPTCMDGLLNQGEIGTDCGGANCAVCANTVLILGGSNMGTSNLGGEFHPGGAWITTNIAGNLTQDAIGLGSLNGVGIGLIRELMASKLMSSTWTAMPAGGVWSPFTQIAAVTTSAAPTLSVGATGNAHAAYPVGSAYNYAAWNGMSWVITGESTTVMNGSSPPQITSHGGVNAALAYVESNNSVSTIDRSGAAMWSNAKTVPTSSADKSMAPALITLSDGTTDMVAWVAFSGTKVFYSTRTGGGNWASVLQISTATSNAPVSLTALPGGQAMVAYRGIDDKVHTSLYTGSSWSAPATLNPTPVDAAPAITHGVGTATAELAYIETTGGVYHMRYISGAWTMAVPVGGSTIKSVAITSIP